tara:strand:+ start:286 stop:528 length:243 start_codon:yes stop_codon:yes gene_type:complete
MNLKDDTVYNRANNEVYVKSEGDLIYVICNKESQQDIVVQKMTTKNCILDSYEEWDEGDDMKWILIFKILDEFDIKPELN